MGSRLSQLDESEQMLRPPKRLGRVNSRQVCGFGAALYTKSRRVDSKICPDFCFLAHPWFYMAPGGTVHDAWTTHEPADWVDPGVTDGGVCPNWLDIVATWSGRA